MRTNCLIFATRLYFRRWLKAQRAAMYWRKSDSGYFPHFGYQEMRHGVIRQISYKPDSPIDRKCPPLFFRGSVRWGDKPKELP